MEAPKITDLESIVNPHLNGGKLVSYKSRYLTKPGENYGSIMLAINAIIEKANGQIEELPLVAKLPPLTNDLYWQIFQPERTSLTENAMYKYVAPGIEELQLEAGIPESDLYDGFSRYYGSRISLNPEATKLDRDAVLVLENLQTSGFKPGNRQKMYDLAHTHVMLESMAQYHGLAIALQQKKPEYFEKYVLPYFKKFSMNTGISAEAKKDMDQQTLSDIRQATNNNEGIVDKITKLMSLYDAYVDAPEPKDSIYNVLAHCDMWINNMMLQYDEDCKPHKIKIVDFQIAQHESLVHDIIFFLLSSVEIKILEENYDNFLKYYFKHFIQCLQRVGVSTDCYTYQSFLDEIKQVGPLEVPHAVFMTRVILTDNSTLPEDFKDMSFDVLAKNTGSGPIIQKMSEILRLSQKFGLL